MFFKGIKNFNKTAKKIKKSMKMPFLVFHMSWKNNFGW